MYINYHCDIILTNYIWSGESMNQKILLKLNNLFPKQVHPFNLQNDGTKSYAQWQYEMGGKTIMFYLDFTTKEDMFLNKVVLDIGCGAGGKTMYYAKCGCEKIYGIDVLASYGDEANKLAKSLGLLDKFEFVAGDAADMPFDDEYFDTIIMNDAMEHVAEPQKVLSECFRVLKKGGRLFVNFPPYHHPFGAHLSDAINIPWVHLFFSDKVLISSYKELVKGLPDGQKRIDFRISKDENGNEYFSYINKMTIKRFSRILKQTPFKIAYYKEVPLRSFLSPLAKLPFVKELFVKMVVCVFEKE